MTGVLAPASLVQGASRQILPYGLFSVVNFRPEDSARWEAGGVQWEYLTDDNGLQVLSGGLGVDGSFDTGLPKTFTAFEDPVGEAGTFAVVSKFKASPVVWKPLDAQARASEVLLTYEQYQVEHEFWNGAATPNLGTVTDSLGAFATDVLALGALEQSVADNYGSLGVIHMNRSFATGLLQNGSLVTQGGKLFTALGTPVIAGGGYGSDVIKASPAIFGYRSGIITSSGIPGDLLDRDHNDQYAVAERMYLLGFDPLGVSSASVTG